MAQPLSLMSHVTPDEEKAKWAAWTKPEPAWFVTCKKESWNDDFEMPQRTLHAIILINLLGLGNISDINSDNGKVRLANIWAIIASTIYGEHYNDFPDRSVLYMQIPGTTQKVSITKDEGDFKSVQVDALWTQVIKDSGCPEMTKWNDIMEKRDHLAAVQYYNEIDMFGDRSYLALDEDGVWRTVDAGTGHVGELRETKHWFGTVFNEYFKLRAEYPD